jgi:hypothetical protein
MAKKVYYLQNINRVNEVIDKVIDSFPCFLKTEPIAMNYQRVTITAMIEDVNSIEKMLAPII